MHLFEDLNFFFSKSRSTFHAFSLLTIVVHIHCIVLGKLRTSSLKFTFFVRVFYLDAISFPSYFLNSFFTKRSVVVIAILIVQAMSLTNTFFSCRLVNNITHFLIQHLHVQVLKVCTLYHLVCNRHLGELVKHTFYSVQAKLRTRYNRFQHLCNKWWLWLSNCFLIVLL